ncbi:hypothetical protein [Subtercola vilae]|uniref:hypothetical protein n=1 Tax=Subtercola vilae TaxID=2056433 RepID=UPI0010A9E63F|nr:hypothetical protein [Subtercola vilae]
MSGITARVFVVFVAVVSLVTAVVLTLTNLTEISSPALQVVALVTLLAAYLYFIWAAEPYRRRVDQRTYAVVYGLVLVACLLNSLSQLGTNLNVRDDWGPVCVALVVMIAGPYRPPGEIIVSTVVGLLVVNASVVPHLATLTGTSPIASFVIVSAPTLALGVGAAIYSSTLIAELHGLRASAAQARELRDVIDGREAVADFLGYSIAPLRDDVLPFFHDVKQRDELTPADVVRASELSSSLRRSLVHSQLAEPLAELAGVFIDPQNLSRRLSEPQRAALRVLLGFLAEQPSVRRNNVSFSFMVENDTIRGAVEGAFTTDRSLSSRVAPFLGLMRLSFTGVTTEVTADSVFVEFHLS